MSNAFINCDDETGIVTEQTNETNSCEQQVLLSCNRLLNIRSLTAWLSLADGVLLPDLADQ